LEFKKNPIAHSKVTLRAMLIGLAFHAELCSAQMLLDQGMHNSEFIQPAIQVSYWSGLRRRNTEVPGSKTVQNFEGGTTQGGME